MEVSNTTPLTVFALEQVDRNRDQRTVIIARGTFLLSADSEPVYATEQTFFTLVDEYYGYAKATSLKRASDLCYAKPRADIYFVDPVAVPGGGRESAAWRIRIEIGQLQTQLHVTGPRLWYKSHIGAWKLSEPSPVPFLQIRYEQAFGGTREGHGGPVTFSENPVGIGFCSSDELELETEIRAPQIFCPFDPPTLPGRSCRVAGLTPVSPAWQPRLKRAGTFDAKWLEHDWPNLPSDFNEGFFNCAPCNLQYPGFLAGGETISISGMTSASPLLLRIPDVGKLLLHVYRMNGTQQSLPMQLDTVVLDLNAMRIVLTWRASLTVSTQVFFAQLQSLRIK